MKSFFIKNIFYEGPFLSCKLKNSESRFVVFEEKILFNFQRAGKFCNNYILIFWFDAEFEYEISVFWWLFRVGLDPSGDAGVSGCCEFLFAGAG